MCTAFFRKGKDVITGFNFDMDEGGLAYIPVIEEDRVFLGLRLPPDILAMMPPAIRPKNGVRLIQGVSAGGHIAGQLCNQNCGKVPQALDEGMVTVDCLTDSFVTERMGTAQLIRLMETRIITNIPGAPGMEPLALHSLLVSPDGNAVFVEPGNGYAVIREDYFTVTNFSLLEPPLDLNEDRFGYYGVDRYRKSLGILKNSTEDFSVADGLALLKAVRQTGTWATRFSFVYSRNENAVYYCTGGDFDRVRVHRFPAVKQLTEER